LFPRAVGWGIEMIGVRRRATPQDRQQTAIIKSIMAPTGGVNARDALANMPPTDAIVLDNWFPTPSYVQVRNGSQTWATGLTSAVETIAAYNGVSNRKLFSWAGGNLFDTTAQGAVGAAVVSALNSARWQTAMFNAGGGDVLLAVDGTDSPLRYDGATQGGAELFGSLVGGSGYDAGGTNTYTNVPLTGGGGSGAQATVVVTAGIVTAVTITAAGSAYVVGNVLSASNSNLGGSGSGFSITLTQVGGWSVTTISGTNSITNAALVPSNLITVTISHQRAWYIENNTMNVWYATINGFQGALTMLPLGNVFKMGGYLMQMSTWTIDNASGINDYSAFITSEGEVAIYQGYDPSTVATWSLVGTFRIGRPIGRRCICKFGSDVLVICTDGLNPLSKLLLTDRTQPDALLTNKIINAINADAAAYGTNFGWQCIEHPLGNKLILNVPEVTDTTAHQWVMNTVSTSNAWCRFKNWNANCWEVQQDSLYFGGAGTVYLADVGLSDSGSAITVDGKPAFSYFDSMTLKQFKMVRPILRASIILNSTPITLNLDFGDVTNTSPAFNLGLTAPWNMSPWNITPWGGNQPSIQVLNWIGVTGIGYAASGRLTFTANNVGVQWQAIDYMYEEGGPL
jgi:hypothetical protein